MMIKNNLKSDKTIEGPAVAVDTVIMAIDNKELKVLLVKINKGEYMDKWALPGGLVRIDENLDEAAQRVILERVSNDKIHLEQLYSFGEVSRDVRGRAISVAYFALLNRVDCLQLRLSDHYSDMNWNWVGNLPDLAFDHRLIIETAQKRLASKLDYSPIVRDLLPSKFTLGEMKTIYELIQNKIIDKRNFIKKIKSLSWIEPINEIKSGEAHRPARLYKFKSN